MWPLPDKTASSEFGKSYCNEASLALKTQLSRLPPLRLSIMTHPMVARPRIHSLPNASRIPAPCTRAIPATALSCGASPTGCTKGTSRMSWSCVGQLLSLFFRRLWTRLSSCGTSAWTSACALSSELSPTLTIIILYVVIL